MSYSKFARHNTNKFGAKRTNGFASGLEATTHSHLQLMEKNGDIRDLRCQHCVELSEAKIRCKIDFSYTDCKTEKLVFVEAKGVETERWLIIKKLWHFYGPAELQIWKQIRSGRIGIAETIFPKEAA